VRRELMTRRGAIAVAMCGVVLAFAGCASVDPEDERRARAVFDALNVDAFDAAETALAAGPDLDLRFEETMGRWTMLQMFAQTSALRPMRWLLEHDADPDVASPEDGRTALHLAVEGGHVEAVELLLEYNADASLRSTFGTPAHLARTLRDASTRERLLALLE